MGEVLDSATGPQPSGRLFTVGIPVFNGKTLLRNCLQSVINSTLPRHRFEILIADDGSSEPETLAILGGVREEPRSGPGVLPSDLDGDQLRRRRTPPKLHPR